MENRQSFSKLSIKTKDAIIIISAFCSALCLLFCIICMVSLSNVRDDISVITASLNSSIQQTNDNYNELYQKISTLESKVDTTQQAVDGSVSTKYIQITKQPESVVTVVGRNGAMIFSVNATGNGLNMVWQKYDEVSGEWINIVFDIDGNCEDLGIRLYDDASHGNSELWTKNLTEKAFGRYRCLITDTAGISLYSEAVTISEKEG